MSTLVIEGGHRLYGRLDVEGNKNSALPLIASCLLTPEECVLHNVPRGDAVTAIVHGKEQWFCSTRCRDEFIKTNRSS